MVEIPLKNPILEVKLTRNGDFGPKEGTENERGGAGLVPLKKPIEILTQYGENNSDSTKQKDIAFQYFSGPLFGNALTKRPEKYDSNGSKVKNCTSDSNGVKKDSEKFLIDCELGELGDSNGKIEIDSSDSVIDQPRTQTVKIAPIFGAKIRHL